jgi:hypothetical protein
MNEGAFCEVRGIVGVMPGLECDMGESTAWELGHGGTGGAFLYFPQANVL